MEIKINLELDDEEKEQLSFVLGCELNDLEAKMEPYAKTALIEYLNMFLGRITLTRINDIKEYRLLLLIQEVFKDKIPEEHDISELFHITASQSKSLIKAVLSKNRYPLQGIVKRVLIETLKKANPVGKDGDYEITINNLNVVDEMNRILGEIDGTLPKIVKKQTTIATYLIKASCHEHLNKHFKIDP